MVYNVMFGQHIVEFPVKLKASNTMKVSDEEVKLIEEFRLRNGTHPGIARLHELVKEWAESGSSFIATPPIRAASIPGYFYVTFRKPELMAAFKEHFEDKIAMKETPFSNRERAFEVDVRKLK